MKVDALIRSLEAIAGAASGDDGEIAEFVRAARAFGGAKTLATFLTNLETLAKMSPAADGPSLGALCNSVDTLAAISEAIGSKTVCSEVFELRRIVRAYPRIPLRSLQFSPAKPARVRRPAKPLRSELVAHYKNEIARLRMGSPELTALFQRLAADTRMRGIEMAALASFVAYETSATMKKSESLRRIQQRHESYLTSAAKSEALRGSSAT